MQESVAEFTVSTGTTQAVHYKSLMRIANDRRQSNLRVLKSLTHNKMILQSNTVIFGNNSKDNETMI